MTYELQISLIQTWPFEFFKLDKMLNVFDPLFYITSKSFFPYMQAAIEQYYFTFY